ncbi:MAG: cytochrome C [Desulfobulbaceae bacterium]|nr:MAG: cytochrome C [Desulfobulbaceae bacterium]
MNYPVWYLPEVGGGFLIALIAVLHVFVSHFAVGGGLYLIYAEKKGLAENSEGILAFTKRHARFFLLLTVVFGSITGVGIWFIIALVNPAATSSLIHIFVFGWAAEWVFFVVEIVAAFVYYYMFGRMDSRTHLQVGWIYFAAAWMSLLLINGIIAFMLTPGAWLQQQGFWRGFFNPSFWPSLFFRTCVAILLAGCYGYLTASFTRDRQVRLAMTRFSGKWALAATVAAIPFAIWYVLALPDQAAALVLGKSPTIAMAVQWGGVALAGLLAITLTAGIVRPGWNLKPVAFAALLLSLAVMGSFEWIREAARRPWVIGGVMYSNMIRASDVPSLNEKGFLQEARWVANRTVTPENQRRAGRELFIHQCYACHTVGGGNNDIVSRTAAQTYSGLTAYIGRMHQVRPFMPPFAGTEAEARALAAYIVGDLHGKEVKEPVAGKGDPGRLVFEQHCASCHQADEIVQAMGGQSPEEIAGTLETLDQISDEMVPFAGSEVEKRQLSGFLHSGGVGEGGTGSATAVSGPEVFAVHCAACHAPEELPEKIAGRDKQELYELLGRLNELNEEMEPFAGTDEERRALAGHLETLAGGAK